MQADRKVLSIAAKQFPLELLYAPYIQHSISEYKTFGRWPAGWPEAHETGWLAASQHSHPVNQSSLDKVQVLNFHGLVFYYQLPNEFQPVVTNPVHL